MSRPSTSAHPASDYTVSDVLCSRPGTATIGRQAIHLPLSQRDTDIKFGDRPLTALGGIGATKRSVSDVPPPKLNNSQVQDMSYFTALLKSKEVSILSEMEKINQAFSLLDQDVSSFCDLKILHGAMLKEVTELELLLADYSAAVEKVCGRSDPEDVIQLLKEIRKSNEILANELDASFLQRQNKQKEIVQIETEINNTQTSMHHYLQKYAKPAQVDIFSNIMSQLYIVQAEEKVQDSIMENLQNSIASLRSDLHHTNGLRTEFKVEVECSERLKKEISQLEDEIKLVHMDPNEARTYLLDKIQVDQSQFLDCDKEIDMMQKRSENVKKRREAMEKDLKELHAVDQFGQNLSQYYNTLIEQDNNITEQSEVDNILKNSLTESHSCLKLSIVALLEEISRDVMKCGQTLPSQEDLQELKNVLDFKERIKEQSKTTTVRLNDHKEKRSSEMKKAEQLEEKIYTEQLELEMRIESMTLDICSYDNVESIQDVADVTKEYLLQLRERYRKRCTFIKKLVQELHMEYKAQSNELDHNEIWQNLISLEETLREQHQKIHSIEEINVSKGRDSEYYNVKTTCLAFVHTLNEELKARAQ